ncbi:MAG: hypothetical protein ACKUBY_03710 [Candidatus Moraniibacteriota bacterium]|jgi:hypothetical protein
MGFFSKMFGGGKLDLTDDIQQDVTENKQVNNVTTENKEPSPFLVDDETEEIKKD